MAKKADIVKTVSSAEVLNKVQYAITILRGKQVLLDFQLAALYGVETKRLNEAVKRNIQRFPEDFMFRVTKEELSSIRSQFATTYLQLPVNGVKAMFLDKRTSHENEDVGGCVGE